MIANYHTHTFRCGHADPFPDEAYVKQAIDAGFSVLGFTDHSPWPYEEGTPSPGVRMTMEMFPEYVASIRSLQEKYRDQIHIYLGLECEYYPQYFSWLKTVKDQLDYVILGNHWPLNDANGEQHFMYTDTAETLKTYYQCFFDAMDTGLFTYVAHPDIGLSSYPVFDNACIDGSYQLCRKAKELDLPLEYNLYGLEKADMTGFSGLGYPCNQFWEIAKDVGCKVLIAYDAHYLRHLSNPSYREKAEDYLGKLGVEILQTLPGLE